MSSNTKECPFCGEEIKAVAIRCRYCHADLTGTAPVPTVAPAAAVLEAGQVVDLLTHLVDKNLVVYEEDERGQGRYRLLETVRQYAGERLRENGEEEPVRDGHRDFFLALAEEAEPMIRGHEQLRWLEVLEAEHDNLRAALEWVPASGAEATLRLAGALWGFWYYRAHWTEGHERLAAVLPRADSRVSAVARAQAWFAAVMLAYVGGDHEALAVLAPEAAARAREGGDRKLLARCLMVAILDAIGRGDRENAIAAGEECLALARELEDNWLLAWGFLAAGFVEGFLGYPERACALFSDGLEPAEAAGDRWVTGLLLGNLASLESLRGEHERAGAHFTRSLTLLRELGETAKVAFLLEGIAGVAGARRQGERGARLLGAATALRAAHNYPVEPMDRPAHEHAVTAVRGGLSAEAFAQAFAQGQTLSLEQAVAYALEQETTP